MFRKLTVVDFWHHNHNFYFLFNSNNTLTSACQRSCIHTSSHITSKGGLGTFQIIQLPREQDGQSISIDLCQPMYALLLILSNRDSLRVKMFNQTIFLQSIAQIWTPLLRQKNTHEDDSVRIEINPSAYALTLQILQVHEVNTCHISEAFHAQLVNMLHVCWAWTRSPSQTSDRKIKELWRATILLGW